MELKYTKSKPYDWYKKEGYKVHKKELLTAWVQSSVYPEMSTPKKLPFWVKYIIIDTVLTGVTVIAIYLIKYM